MARVTIQNFKYLVVNCGYTTRFIKHIDKIKKFLPREYADQDFPPSLLYIEDGDLHPVSPKSDEIERVRSRVGLSRGVIVFECQDLCQALPLILSLMNFGHCALFDITTLYKMEFIDGNILVMTFDTESG